MRRTLTTVVSVLGGGVLVVVLIGVLTVHGHDLAAAVALLGTVCPAWLSVAALAEAVSYLTRGRAIRAVLQSAAPAVGTAALTAITVLGDAVAYVLPVGFAAGGAVAVGQIHRRGAPRAAAWWGLAVITLLSVAVLGVMGLVAVGIALFAVGPAALPPGQGLLAVVAVVGGAAAVGRWGLPHRLRERWDRIRGQPLAAGSLAAAAFGVLVSWLADLAVLAAAFVALGERPPWAGLVLAYCLGQAASALPFTPGGLAVVEGGLTATLVAFGGCPAGALTAVLLYRLISHWAVVPAGALAWLVLRRRTADEFRGPAWSAFVAREGDEPCRTRP